MHGSDVFRMVISPGSAHSFWVSVVRHDFAAVVKFMVANRALSSLLHDFSVQQFSHFRWGTEFAISPRVERISRPHLVIQAYDCRVLVSVAALGAQTDASI